MTRVARYLRLDVLLLLFCVGGLIRYGSTKGTNGRVSICPDYDYQLNCGNNGVPPANVIVDDPASLLGRNGAFVVSPHSN